MSSWPPLALYIRLSEYQSQSIHPLHRSNFSFKLLFLHHVYQARPPSTACPFDRCRSSRRPRGCELPCEWPSIHQLWQMLQNPNRAAHMDGQQRRWISAVGLPSEESRHLQGLPAQSRRILRVRCRSPGPGWGGLLPLGFQCLQWPGSESSSCLELVLP